ncbi:hypothetical protein Gotur_031104, partial [Gossypium turneri]
MDSRCSLLMCPNRDWFSTYSLVEDRVVCMGNDSPSK